MPLEFQYHEHEGEECTDTSHNASCPTTSGNCYCLKTSGGFCSCYHTAEDSAARAGSTGADNDTQARELTELIMKYRGVTPK